MQRDEEKRTLASRRDFLRMASSGAMALGLGVTAEARTEASPSRDAAPAGIGGTG